MIIRTLGIMPAISLLMPIYNAERFLAEAIRSVQIQTFEDFEVICVLDGCTDCSEEILMSVKDPRFRVLKNDSNRGVAYSSNRALAEAAAPLAGRMDADDVSEPDRLQRQIAYLKAHPEVMVLGTRYDRIDEHGVRIHKAFPLPTEPDAVRKAFRNYVALGNSTVLFRTDAIRAVGGFEVEFSYADELVVWLKCLAQNYPMANLPEVLHHYRIHSNQLMSQKRAETLAKTTEAYRLYGPQIWGDDAPEMDFETSILIRAKRKLRRLLLKGKWD
jgi:glycosyltransferase involved in cell wall biosynthesis